MTNGSLVVVCVALVSACGSVTTVPDGATGAGGSSASDGSSGHSMGAAGSVAAGGAPGVGGAGATGGAAGTGGAVAAGGGSGMGGAGGSAIAPDAGGTGGAADGGGASRVFFGNFTTLIGDVNGDGKADLIAVNYDKASNTGNTQVMTSTGSGFNAPTQWTGNVFAGNLANLMGDVNGDGKADLIGINVDRDNNTGNTYVMTSTGTAFNPPALWTGIVFAGNLTSLAGDVNGDVNGDGKADLIGINVDRASNTGNTYVMTSTGTSFNAPALWTGTVFAGTLTNLVGNVNGDLVGDVNGDGKADLIGINVDRASNTGNTYVMTSSGSGFNSPALWTSTVFAGTLTNMMGDIDGDGKSDLVGINYNKANGTGNTYVMTSTGTAFNPPVPWSTAPFAGSLTTLAGDVSGDGKSDIVGVNSVGGIEMLSTGSSFGTPKVGW